jgi:signal transduction histidine kinase
VLVVVLAAVAVDLALDSELGQPFFAVAIALFTLGRHGSNRASAIGTALVAVAVLTVDLPRLQDGDRIEDVVPAWFVLGGVWGLGRWVRSRQAETAHILAHNAQLERDREEATRAAVAQERALIARELHDLVAHSLAVIVIQAQAADRVIAADPAAARKALGAIESMGREGLGELRRLLDLLLLDADEVELGPRPSLQQLDLLVDRVGKAGLQVSLHVEGRVRGRPPAGDLSADRIVQEALTNVLKHAAGASTAVTVTYRRDDVDICVTNSAAHSPSRARPVNGQARVRSHGRGLIGMQERAALYGGSVRAEPVATGGFTVHATLPTVVS